MPDASLSVLLGLASALAWGSADFAGGLASRSAPVFGVVVLGQVVGLVLAGVIALATGEPVASVADLAWAIGAGVCGGLGITCLYRGLATGRMGVVAPITAVLAACVPVVVSALVEGAPGPGRAVGIAAALVAVVLVSRSSAPGGGRAGVGLALVGGLGFGLFNTCIAQLPDGLVFGPLAAARTTEAFLLGVVAALAGQPWRIPRPFLPLVLVAGTLDMAGNGFFIAAAQAGRLDVAAVLSSLYPVMTVLLAAAVLRERIVRGHALGIAAALFAIVLVSLG